MNKFERYSIVAGIALSAISAVASAYAAWQTAAQAKIALQALTASDLNHTFEGFLDDWTALCNTIDLTGGYIGFDVRSTQNLQMIIVEATDLGYDFKPLDNPFQRMNVIKAMDKAVAAQDKLTLWLPSERINTMGFNAVMANLIMLSRVDTSESEARHFSSMLKQVGYCKIWKTWFMNWFKQGYPPAPNVIYKDVRLAFNSRDGSALNDDYIRESRKLPWDEIHRFAPP
ncbi:hypothetical protein [Mesorhizobium sp. CA12]|uniref:hypothetical protein n=1 Tax=Mesorhizobium sp. CA12 TaxID=2876644 RepID=UPI001CCC03BC|nr:hypothetical protein [Mesorhizobium sp. CA12]MBZ9862742.1 hypothetical protein [Mesorhizobium sp. CA12]